MDLPSPLFAGSPRGSPDRGAVPLRLLNLFNHAKRTFLFGLAGRTTEKLSDEETLYVPCILHDLGITEQFRGDPPVEIHGVESTKKFSSEQGYSRDRTETAGTELPSTPRHRRIQRLEIALVGQGAGADV